jgi:hypothetical protein
LAGAARPHPTLGDQWGSSARDWNYSVVGGVPVPRGDRPRRARTDPARDRRGAHRSSRSGRLAGLHGLGHPLWRHSKPSAGSTAARRLTAFCRSSVATRGRPPQPGTSSVQETTRSCSAYDCWPREAPHLGHEPYLQSGWNFRQYPLAALESRAGLPQILQTFPAKQTAAQEPDHEFWAPDQDLNDYSIDAASRSAAARISRLGAEKLPGLSA